MALVPAMPDLDEQPMRAAFAIRSVLVALVGFIAGLMIAAIAIPVAAHAEVAPAASPPSKTRSVIVYGDDPCPKSEADEIVVCARQPESDRYRIPRQFRGKKAGPAARSWSSNVRSDDDASRMAAGLPNTCSAVGTGGQTGCFLQFQSEAAAERRQAANAKDTSTPSSDVP